MPTNRLDFIGTVSINQGYHAYSFPNFGHFRRHDGILKRLPCLRLKFPNFLTVGMLGHFRA